MIDPQRHAVLWLLVAFVLATAVTRTLTRLIRHRADQAEKYLKENAHDGIIRNMVIAGIHVHHQVWGILILLFTGLLMFTYSPGHGLAQNLLAASFGIGAALTLDEFAMWLHLEDVYWKEEGRTSVTALIIAATIITAMAVGANPLDVYPHADGQLSGAVIAGLAVLNGVFVIVSILKGKLATGLIGAFVPLVAQVGAIRLAIPGSWWARRRYAPGSTKDARSQERFGAAYQKRWDAVRDFIGGRPSQEPKSLRERLREERRAFYRATPAERRRAMKMRRARQRQERVMRNTRAKRGRNRL